MKRKEKRNKLYTGNLGIGTNRCTFSPRPGGCKTSLSGSPHISIFLDFSFCASLILTP